MNLKSLQAGPPSESMNRSFLMGLALALLLSAEASGQSHSPFNRAPTGPFWRADVAGSRQDAGMEPVGARLGGMNVQAAISTTIAGDSNVQRTAVGAQSDAFVIVAPQVSAASETADRRIVLQARTAAYRYARLTSQDRETYTLSGDVEFRIKRNTVLAARASQRQSFEPFASAAASETVGNPARYNALRGEIGSRTETGNLRLSTLVSVERREYAAIVDVRGRTVDQNFRDTRTLSLAINGEVATPTLLTPVFAGDLSSISSLAPQACCDRSGRGGSATAGVHAQVTPLLAFELTGGFAFRNFTSGALKGYSGPIWHARGEWYPSPLITVTADVSRSIENGGLRDAAGVVADRWSGKLYYEVRRNLDAVITVSGTREDYRGTGIIAHDFATGIDLKYVATRHLQGTAYVIYRDRTASNPRLPGVGSAIEGGLSLRTAL